MLCYRKLLQVAFLNLKGPCSAQVAVRIVVDHLKSNQPMLRKPKTSPNYWLNRISCFLVTSWDQCQMVAVIMCRCCECQGCCEKFEIFLYLQVGLQTVPYSHSLQCRLYMEKVERRLVLVTVGLKQGPVVQWLKIGKRPRSSQLPIIRGAHVWRGLE